MLQRAASNAYTWWWAKQIRTKQSKWLSNDLQEMEERVKATIKLIDEDADSFAKKAEMYFKRRPELISSVEEAYRAYKALADRYDRISRELHQANHTIATALPDHVPLMEEDDEDIPPNSNPPPDVSKFPKPPPELPHIASRSKKPEAPKNQSPQHKRSTLNFTFEQAQKEIDRLQKSILVLQTEKEFFKSSYERGLTKYWDIEGEMTEIQEEISTLQDEFNARSVIDDDEARALMAAAALKTCEDSLISLREQQKRSLGDAMFESKRILVAKEKLRALKGQEIDKDAEISSTTSTIEDEVENLKHERLELQSICDKVKELFVISSESSVADLAEKIDELVEKVIQLEITVSSQTVQILSLRAETDELHKQLRGVEEDKKNFNVDPNSVNERLSQVEVQLQRILDLERKVHDEKGVVQSHFAEACNSLNDLSEKLQSPTKKNFTSNTEPSKEIKRVAVAVAAKKTEDKEKLEKKVHEEDISDQNDEEIPEWQEMDSNGMESREKILLYEYTSITQNYKDTRKRLIEMEKKSQDYHTETMQQLQELRCANAIKDEEIRTLRRKLFSAESLRKNSAKKPENSHKLDELISDTDDAESEVLDPISEEEIKLSNLDQLFNTTPLEEKFREDIDTVLDENLDFWLRFSTSYHQIQKFQTSFKELLVQAEKEIEDKDSAIIRVSSEKKGSADTVPIDKKLREFNTELQVWLEHNGLLQGELRCRFDSLCSIQEEIAKFTKSNEGEEVKFTPYQAAKFQGEVINMQQENNKVAKELQAGLDHVKGLEVEVGKALSKLQEKFELSSSKAPTHQYNQFRHFSTLSRVPLKTFLFATKPKKPSIFACMNPVYHHRHHVDMKGGKLHKTPQ